MYPRHELLPREGEVTRDTVSHARFIVLSELTQWLRNLLALIGVLTVIVLLTSETSSSGSLELLVGRKTSAPSGVQGPTAASSGVIVYPIDPQ